MATITQNVITLLEQAKRRYNGEVQKVAEILDQMNQIVETAAAYEANDVHSHTVTLRHALPTINERGPNEGASSTISQVRQVREGLMVLDSIVQMDELIYDPEPDFREFLMSEVAAQMEGTMQTFGNRFVYGNVGTNPKAINGLATRYNALASNVISAGGTGSDLTSAYLVEWGKNTAYLFYPKGSEAGIRTVDLGENTLYDASSNPYRGYEYQVQMKIGLAIPDADRAVQRLANIESAGTANNLRAEAVTANLTLMVDQLPSFGRNAVLYVNRTTKGQIDVWAQDKGNGAYTIQTLEDGTMLTRFQGVPIKVIEQILDTESAVS